MAGNMVNVEYLQRNIALTGSFRLRNWGTFSEKYIPLVRMELPHPETNLIIEFNGKEEPDFTIDGMPRRNEIYASIKMYSTSNTRPFAATLRVYKQNEQNSCFSGTFFINAAGGHPVVVDRVLVIAQYPDKGPWAPINSFPGDLRLKFEVDIGQIRYTEGE